MAEKKFTEIMEDPNEGAIGEIKLELKGAAPLIVHKMSQKIIKNILDKQMGKAQGKKPPKNPEQDALGCIHWIGDPAPSFEEMDGARYGFPVTGFKASSVRAAKLCGIHMTDARSAMWIYHDALGNDGTPLAEITSETGPVLREDPVPIQRTWDIRHRAMFQSWAVTLHIEYNHLLATPQKIVSWFKLAGRSVGIGEWRPGGKSTSGTFGTFDVINASARIPDLEKSS